MYNEVDVDMCLIEKEDGRIAQTESRKGIETLQSKRLKFSAEERDELLAGLRLQYRIWTRLIDRFADTSPNIQHIEFMKNCRNACVTAFQKVDGRDLTEIL
jgi:hypothetical protein